MTTAAALLSALDTRGTTQDTGNLAGVVLLEQDPTLLRLIAVWPNVPLTPLPLAVSAPADLPADRHLRWLWSLLEPDPISRWIETAALPDAPHIRRACYLAIDNRMVLPDGTLSRWVAQYVRNLVGGTLTRRGVRVDAPAPTTASTPAPTGGGSGGRPAG